MYSYLLLFVFDLQKDFCSVNIHTDVNIYFYFLQKNCYIACDFIFVSCISLLKRFSYLLRAFFRSCSLFVAVIFSWYFYMYKKKDIK